MGLAMDAFSVSMANGLDNPGMRKAEMGRIAGTFAFFQWFMPMLGWIFVHTIVLYFQFFERIIPWIALILLCHIGGKMIYDSFHYRESETKEDAKATRRLDSRTLLLQGIATSIDALSVGFTISEYHFMAAFASALIIAVVTFLICCAGLVIGRMFGMKLAGNANRLGGVILIAIGLEIFVSHMF